MFSRHTQTKILHDIHHMYEVDNSPWEGTLKAQMKTSNIITNIMKIFGL